MNRLVSYTETSSDDDEVSRSDLSSCSALNKHEFTNSRESQKLLSDKTSQKNGGDNISDPITDESDFELPRKDARSSSSDSEFDTNRVPVHTKCINFLSSTFSSNESESDENNLAHHKKAAPLKTTDHQSSTAFQADITTGGSCSIKPTSSSHKYFSETRSKSSKNSPLQPDHSEMKNVLSDRIEPVKFIHDSKRIDLSVEKNYQQSETTHGDGSELSNDESEKHLALGISQRKRKLQTEREKEKRLCVPDVIHSMYTDRQAKWMDDPTQHDNRIRSFPHVEGNWATFVHIPVRHDDRLVRFVQEVLQFLNPLSFQVLPDFHISLSRTVAIRHHWIEPLVDSLRQNLKQCKSCIGDISAVRLFANDERTRTFVCLELAQDEEQFLDYVRAVDKSFAEFKLPAYYENPSFHISIGWCLGDVTSRVPQEKLQKLKEMLGEFVACNPDLSVVYVQQICCQSGNKTFVLTLDD